MHCVLCRWLCDRFCPPEMGRDAFWDYVHDWEASFAVDWEPWVEDEGVRQRGAAAAQLVQSDPHAAIAEFSDLAAANFAWASRWLGHLYSTGQGVPRDLKQAEKHYYDALLAGSWMGSLELATLLHKHSINEKWESILADGDRQGFIPSSFWLACYRHKASPTRSTAREVRPVLEKAANAGHPGARQLLAKWKICGKFGLGEIRQGFREARLGLEQFKNRELPSVEREESSEREAA